MNRCPTKSEYLQGCLCEMWYPYGCGTKCRKFNASIKRINQSNGGFHHEPCKECLEYKIQQSDINYIRKRYEKRR